MFKAIRDSAAGFGTRIGAAWRDMRGRGMVRLFLFEFVVVLLGVLAAQALASWVSERNAQAEVLQAKDALEIELAASLATSQVWDAALPCLEARVMEVATRASNGEQIPASLVARPTLYGSDLTPLGEGNSLRLNRLVGADAYQNYSAMIDHTNRIDRMSQAIAADWVQFSRVEPSMGPVREGDILAARDAAARIRSHLRSIAISINAIGVAGSRLGIEPEVALFDGQQVLPLTSCGQLSEEGAIYRLD